MPVTLVFSMGSALGIRLRGTSTLERNSKSYFVALVVSSAKGFQAFPLFYFSLSFLSIIRYLGFTMFMVYLFTILGIACFFSCIIPVLVYLPLGWFLFRLGRKKLGHWLVSMGAPYSMWLLDNCPHSSCKECRSWTCPAYDKKHHHLCKCSGCGQTVHNKIF